jgi:hypothetical protein
MCSRQLQKHGCKLSPSDEIRLTKHNDEYLENAEEQAVGVDAWLMK